MLLSSTTNNGGITPYQQLLLRRLRHAFSSVRCWINPHSDLVVTDFESAFRTRLVFHDSVIEEPLNKKSFEYAFRDAYPSDG